MSPLKSIVLDKWTLVLRVSTHIYGVSNEIDGKTFIFTVNLGMSLHQINYLGKTSAVLRVSTHIYVVSKDIHWKRFISRVNIGMSPIKSIVSENQALFWGFQHTFMGFPSTDGITFISRVNLGMWLFKSIISEKQALFWRFQHIFMGFAKENRWNNMFIFRVNS